MPKAKKVAKKKKPETKLETETPSFHKESKTTTLDDMTLLFHAPPGAGKTYLAATASEAWPKQLPSKKMIDLEDMIWIGIDAGATAGFASLGINIPKYIDFRDALVDYSVVDAMKQIQDYIDAKLMEPGSWLVVDTLSMLDRYLLEYYEGRTTESWAIYRMIGHFHRRLFADLSLITSRIIFLCHSKAPFQGDDAKTKTRQKAQIAGMAEIVPDLAGNQARGVYVANVSLLGTVLPKRDPKGGGSERILYPLGDKGFEGKSRWEHILNREEPPHLGKLFKKILDAQP